MCWDGNHLPCRKVEGANDPLDRDAAVELSAMDEFAGVSLRSHQRLDRSLQCRQKLKVVMPWDSYCNKSSRLLCTSRVVHIV